MQIPVSTSTTGAEANLPRNDSFSFKQYSILDAASRDGRVSDVKQNSRLNALITL